MRRWCLMTKRLMQALPYVPIHAAPAAIAMECATFGVCRDTRKCTRAVPAAQKQRRTTCANWVLTATLTPSIMVREEGCTPHVLAATLETPTCGSIRSQYGVYDRTVWGRRFVLFSLCSSIDGPKSSQMNWGGLRQFCCASFSIQRVKMCFSARRLASLRR